MSDMMRRFGVGFTIVVLVALSLLPAGAGGRATDAPAAAQLDTDYVTVQLADAPLASYTGTIASYARTKPQAGKELNLNSAAARAYGGYLAGKRQNYKKWLATNAAGAQIVHEFSLTFNGFAVKLNGEKSDKLGQGPGTHRVDPSFLVRPAMNISPALINAPALWAALGGTSNAGAGVKVGILDTGIDTGNPFLSDSGYPATAQTDACAPFTKPAGAPNTTNKVIVCRIFASGVAPGAHVSPSDLIVFDHGTHVSGTVAGNNGTTATVEGTTVTIAGLSGIAPSAWLGDYNIFPGFGAGFVAFGGSAFSHDIIAAIEAAIGDGMDVLNMSIGGKVQGPHDTLAEAVDAAADAGVIVAVAAGNSGPGDSTVESPGSAAGALTAGASTNPHFVGQTVSGVHSLGTVGAAVGQFTTYPDPAVTESWVSFGTNLACTANVPAPTTSPQIAVISRGTCTFTTKVRNAQNAGYAGVVIRNNVAGDPIGMAQDGTTPVPTIPAVMIQRGDLAGTSGTATAGGPLAESVSTNSDIIAGFSSRGPTPFTFLIKPDATAPGVNVLSSVFDGKFAFFQGTSMATPHLAGSSAVLLQFFQGVYGSSPALPYTDIVKSAIVNNAKRPVGSSSSGAPLSNPLARGGGRVDLLAAMNAKAFLRPVSVSFGLWTGSRPIAASRSVTIANSSTSSARTYTLAVEFASPATPGVSVTTNAGSVVLGPNGVGSFTVNLSIAQAVGSGDHFGDIKVTETGSGTVLRIPFWVRVNRGP